MPVREAGDSSLHLPVLGLGCWSFGGSESDYWGAQNDKDTVQAAIDAGVTYLDTAEIYNGGPTKLHTRTVFPL